MSNSIYQFDENAVNELSTIEIAYEILKQTKNPFYFKELADKVGEVKNLNSERLLEFLPQLYTEINIDGRFIHLGKNEWGLKRWYSLEKAETLQLLKDTEDDDEDEDIIYLNDDEDELDEIVDDELYKVDKDNDDDDDDDVDIDIDTDEVEDIDGVSIDDELTFDEEDEEKDLEDEEEEDLYFIIDESNKKLSAKDELEDNL